MKSFIYNGFHRPTFTSTDDPLLKVIEVDDGQNWSIKFYSSNNTLIDYINMEHPMGSEIDSNVKELLVYDESGVILGTVKERLSEAIYLTS
jgi:hypothetical protein